MLVLETILCVVLLSVSITISSIYGLKIMYKDAVKLNNETKSKLILMIDEELRKLDYDCEEALQLVKSRTELIKSLC